MFTLFRKEDSQQNMLPKLDSEDSEDIYGSTGEYAPNTLIAYKKNLINILKSEHRSIQKVLDDIAVHFYQKNIKKVYVLLDEFRHQYKTHVLKEHVLLYAYLRHSTKQHEKLYNDICLSERYMRRLSKKVIKFCDKWEQAEASEFKVSFSKEFNRVYAIVSKRNSFEEEKLFKAYREPKAYLVD